MIYGFLVGLYIGFLLWKRWTAKAFLTERCECGGSGFELFMNNHVEDCKTCNGFGHIPKPQWYWKLFWLFKWTHP